MGYTLTQLTRCLISYKSACFSFYKRLISATE
jgi:hypothetical protein